MFICSRILLVFIYFKAINKYAHHALKPKKQATISF